MKRKYSKPETTCIDINAKHMICGSITGTSIEGFSCGGDTESANVTEAGSRGGFWDDEE